LVTFLRFLLARFRARRPCDRPVHGRACLPRTNQGAHPQMAWLAVFGDFRQRARIKARRGTLPCPILPDGRER